MAERSSARPNEEQISAIAGSSSAFISVNLRPNVFAGLLNPADGAQRARVCRDTTRRRGDQVLAVLGAGVPGGAAVAVLCCAHSAKLVAAKPKPRIVTSTAANRIFMATPPWIGGMQAIGPPRTVSAPCRGVSRQAAWPDILTLSHPVSRRLLASGLSLRALPRFPSKPLTSFT